MTVDNGPFVELPWRRYARWWDDAACGAEDPELFFPQDRATTEDKRAAEAGEHAWRPPASRQDRRARSGGTGPRGRADGGPDAQYTSTRRDPPCSATLARLGRMDQIRYAIWRSPAVSASCRGARPLDHCTSRR